MQLTRTVPEVYGYAVDPHRAAARVAFRHHNLDDVVHNIATSSSVAKSPSAGLPRFQSLSDSMGDNHTAEEVGEITLVISRFGATRSLSRDRDPGLHIRLSLFRHHINVIPDGGKVGLDFVQCQRFIAS